MSLILDMKSKASVRITNKAFNLENNILTLPVQITNYDLTGKTVTAVFEPGRVETGQLEVVGDMVNIPIYSSLVEYGINYIQLNFRWNTNKLEQSGKMMWVIDKSLQAQAVEQEYTDIISDLMNQIRNLDKEYQVAEANRDDLYSVAEAERDTKYDAAEADRDEEYFTAETGRNTEYDTEIGRAHV